jgi:hypothetical protein
LSHWVSPFHALPTTVSRSPFSALPIAGEAGGFQPIMMGQGEPGVRAT